MRRRCRYLWPAALVLALAVVAPVASQNVGGGVSFWVPESLYLGRGGSVGVESALGSSVGLGDVVSLPFGIAYNKVYGLLPEGAIAGTTPSPWFVSDSILGYVMVKARVGLGPLYVDLFGGGAGVWNATLLPLTKNIEGDLAAVSELLSFAGGPTVEGGRLGWGWQAGGGIGTTIGPASVDLNVTFRSVKSPASISGTYFSGDPAGPALTGPDPYGPESFVLRLTGLSIGIDASVKM